MFLKARIHLMTPSPNELSNHYSFIKFLLDIYDSPKIPITYDELCHLIEHRIEFTKFIQYFEEEQQLKAINTLLSQPNKDYSHI